MYAVNINGNERMYYTTLVMYKPMIGKTHYVNKTSKFPI